MELPLSETATMEQMKWNEDGDMAFRISTHSPSQSFHYSGGNGENAKAAVGQGQVPYLSTRLEGGMQKADLAQERRRGWNPWPGTVSDNG